MSLNGNELSWVDEQVSAIKPERVGVSKSEIAAIKDPFIIYNTIEKIDKDGKKSVVIVKKDLDKIKFPKEEKKVRLILQAIINNSVLINDKWYKIGEKIGKYTLKDIRGTLVMLVYKKKKLVLSTDTYTQNLKFKN